MIHLPELFFYSSPSSFSSSSIISLDHLPSRCYHPSPCLRAAIHIGEMAQDASPNCFYLLLSTLAPSSMFTLCYTHLLLEVLVLGEYMFLFLSLLFVVTVSCCKILVCSLSFWQQM